MKQKLFLRHAESKDLMAVYRLYRSGVGRIGCAWDADYPGLLELQQDFAGNNLYVFSDGSCILGAVSVVDPPELADESCWTDSSFAEISRVVVDASVSGQGYATCMLCELFAVLKNQRIYSVRLSVSLGNEAALRLYQRLDFRFLTRKEIYGGTYYLCEKVLTE